MVDLLSLRNIQLTDILKLLLRDSTTRNLRENSLLKIAWEFLRKLFFKRLKDLSTNQIEFYNILAFKFVWFWPLFEIPFVDCILK